ncbi:MAG: hypothetical protein ACRELB_21425 [Polyangiaceae bacterium]
MLEEIPGDAPIRYFPETRSERPLLVRFRLPDGSSWVGGFGAGRLAARACSGVFASPSPKRACVVSGGRVYAVDVEHPDRTTVVVPELVMQVVPDVVAGLLLLADPWQLHGYAADGLKWSSGRIAIEGLSVLAADAQTALVCMENADGELEERKVDVRTGRLVA